MSKIGDRLRALAELADASPSISCVGVICTGNEEVALSCIDPSHPELMQIETIARCIAHAGEHYAAQQRRGDENSTETK